MNKNNSLNKMNEDDSLNKMNKNNSLNKMNEDESLYKMNEDESLYKMNEDESLYKMNEDELINKFTKDLISIKNLPNDKYYEIFSSSLLELKVIQEDDLINVTIIPKKINEIFNNKDFKFIHIFMIHVLQKINDYQNSL
jgi:hypothetical protein